MIEVDPSPSQIRSDLYLQDNNDYLGNFVGSRKYSQCSPFSWVFLGLLGEDVSDLQRVDPWNNLEF